MVISGRSEKVDKRDENDQLAFAQSLKTEQQEHFGFPPEPDKKTAETAKGHLPYFICAASLRGISQTIYLPNNGTNHDLNSKGYILTVNAHHKTPYSWAIRNSWPVGFINNPANGIILDTRVHDEIHTIAEAAIRKRAEIQGIQLSHAYAFSELNEDWVTPTTVAVVANYFEWITADKRNMRTLDFLLPGKRGKFIYVWEKHLISKGIFQTSQYDFNGNKTRNQQFVPRIPRIPDIRLKRNNPDSPVQLNLLYDQPKRILKIMVDAK